LGDPRSAVRMDRDVAHARPAPQKSNNLGNYWRHPRGPVAAAMGL
jgi:hypothetical protein